MNPQTKSKIESFIKNNSVALFMKGNKEMPQCGFSRQVVSVLSSLTSDFETFDILSDQEVREGIKEYSQWPTLPQLYINQEFIGGCDIVTDLFNTGELANMLGLKKALKKPDINLSQTALDAFKNALIENDTQEAIRIRIGANFRHELEFDEQAKEDFLFEFDGVNILIDPYSAARANDLSIDFKTDSIQAGFVFENPNAPKEHKELSVEELNKWHKENSNFLLIDVRPYKEWEIAHISFAKKLEDLSKEFIEGLDKNQNIVLHCHHGGRSSREAQKWSLKGFKNVYNLTGGIDAWSKKIDSTVKIY